MRTGPKSILGLGTPLSLRGPLCPGKGGGVIPPPGFVFLVDYDGAYLTDQDGAYLLEAA